MKILTSDSLIENVYIFHLNSNPIQINIIFVIPSICQMSQLLSGNKYVNREMLKLSS